jgi:hypothetical protein
VNLLTQGECGSWSRDVWKWSHKQSHPSHWGCDLDFCIVGKNPARIIAIFDYKNGPRDRIRFTEAIAYQALLKIAPVFIVQSPCPFCGPFTITRLLATDYRPEPPRCEWGESVIVQDWGGFHQWETKLRANVIQSGQEGGDKPPHEV